MTSVVSALLAALKTLIHPKMLALILWPMLVAVVLWMVAAFFFWDGWVASLTGMVQATPLEQWMQHGSFAVVTHYLIVIVLALLLLPAIHVTALLITSVFAMPVMLDHVAQRYFPDLERKRGGSTMGSVANATTATVVYLIGWVSTLPLWLFSPFAMVVPFMLMAYLNQRLFRYDALAEHASRDEYVRVIGRSRPKLYLLGTLLGLMQFVPLLNLVLPIYVGLAFIHLCLAELERLRHPV